MRIVSVDTNILIWGIKNTASEGQEYLISRAQDFFKWLDENNIKVIIPAPIITELLAPVEPEKHEEFLKIIHSKFRVAAVDEAAAVKCAEIWQIKKNDEEIRKYREENKIARETMKYDFQIAAVAIVRGAECLFSHDPHMQRFVGDIITVKEMPVIHRQTELDFKSG